MRLKDDIISETGSGGGRIEENGQIKRCESPDFDDNNDISGLEDGNIIGGGLQRDISLDKLKNIITTTKSGSDEVDWKVNKLSTFATSFLNEYLYNHRALDFQILSYHY